MHSSMVIPPQPPVPAVYLLLAWKSVVQHDRPRGHDWRARRCSRAFVPTSAGVLGGISMSDTGVTSSDPVPTLEDVGREFPGWHYYAPGVNGMVFASLRGSSPLVVVRGPDPVTLGEEIRSWTAG